MTESLEEKVPGRVYEVAYLLSPNVGEDKLGEKVSLMKSLLEKHGAFIISDDFPKFRQLAYTLAKPMGGKNEKFTSAFFGWTKFEASAEVVQEIKNELERDIQIIRLLIVKTDRENQPAAKFFTRRTPVKREAPKTEGKPAGPSMTEAEIDKTIAELIVE